MLRHFAAPLFQVMTAVLAVLALNTAHGSEGTRVRACQSSGEFEGRMVFVNIWQLGYNSYKAVFTEAPDLDSRRTPLTTVYGIRRGVTVFGGHAAWVDGKGFEFTSDPDDRSAAEVRFIDNGKSKFVLLNCNRRI